MSDNVTYGLDYWRDALEAAGIESWCPTDSLEKHGPLAQWLCLDVIDHEKVGRNEAIIEAAFEALKEKDETEFSAERLMTVVLSYRGETVDDFEQLAREYARDDYTGPDNPEDNDWEGFNTEADFEKWFVAWGQTEGEICVTTEGGGTLYWFNTHQW